MINYVIPPLGRRKLPNELAKLFRIMRITMLLLVVGCVHLSATSMSQTITLKANRQSLPKVFELVEKQTGYQVLYSDRFIQSTKPVTISADRMPLGTFMQAVLTPESLTYQIFENTILISRLATDVAGNIDSEMQSQQRMISGTVTDESGTPLEGVTVSAKGTPVAVKTGGAGEYRIEFPLAGTMLVFTNVGFEPAEYAVGNRSRMDVSMKASMSDLDEVVVVGYGTQRKKDVTGSVSSVKGEDLEKTPATTFVQSLQGKIPGVDIKAASNAPGGGMRIRIRGTNSINASSEPLYVIDGFPVMNGGFNPQGAGNQANPADPLASISPNEIESVEILKDASATAIYGSRGANGVVLITTKRGKEGKAKIDFGYSLNVASIRKKLDLANAEQLAVLTNEWAANNGQPAFYDGVKKPLPEELGEGTDWQDVIFRTAPTADYNLSVSGGTENTKYLVAGSYLNQDGIIIESNFKRAGLKFNLDQHISKRIKLGVNMNASRTVNDAVPSDGTGYQHDSPLWSALTTTPAIAVRDEEGNYIHNHNEGIEKIIENPVSIARTRTDITYANRVLSSAFADVEIIDDLTFRANFGADIVNSKRNIYVPNTAQTQALPNIGIASVGTIQFLNWLAEYTLTYNKAFGSDHRLSVLAGYTVQNSDNESVFSEAQGFSTNSFSFNNLAAGSNPRPSQTSKEESGLLSYIGRINYAYRDKYLFTGTIRRDGSSKFGEDNKWGYFPSVGIAWVLSEEPFLRNSNLLSNLKLRSSYGLTGNQDIGSYASLALYNTTRTILGGEPVIGFAPNRIANPDLKWEKTNQFNVGVDAEFLKGKFQFSAEYYIKNTKDLLLNVTIPNQSGYSNSIQNIGEVENRGVELSAGFNTIGKLKWSSSVNISFNRNKVVSLAEGTERLIFTLGRGEASFGSSIAIPGRPLGSFYGYRFLGIWQSAEEITEAGNSVGGVNRPGLPKYEDLNGDGFRQNDDDRAIIGDPNPDFIFGFSNNFSFRDFSLFVFVNGSYGNEIFNLNRIALLSQPQKHNVLQVYYDQRWRGPGTSNTIEAPLHNAGEWKNGSDRDVLDGSFLRVKTVTLSYHLPEKLLKGVGWLRNTQVYLSGENLLTFTNYSGFDPEVDLYASSNTQMGVDNGSYPASKSVRFGFKVGF